MHEFYIYENQVTKATKRLPLTLTSSVVSIS